MNDERQNQNEAPEELFDDDFFSLEAEPEESEEIDEVDDVDADGVTEEQDEGDAPEESETDAEEAQENGDGGDTDEVDDAPESDAERESEKNEEEESPEDFEARANEDLAELCRLYPALGITSLRDLNNAKRFGELREKGLSVREAFYATNADMLMQRAEATGAARANGKAHLGGVKGKASTGEGSAMTGADRALMREFFGDDAPSSEIEKYWRQAKK